MPAIVIKNLSRPMQGELRVKSCASFACRLRGLTFRRELGILGGLLLDQGRDSRVEAAIHMLGVFMDLAVIWINQEGEVVDRRLARAWRPFYAPRAPARYVLETAPERLGDFEIGDRLAFEDPRRP
jgi:uncharacterized membrane protein (UPF0127 family)